MNAERFFTTLADQTDAGPTECAQSHLKARIYSALVVAQAAHGALRSLPTTKAAGRPLCVFENVLCLVPGERVVTMNPCRVCHARVLAEQFDSPPIYWPHCPYVDFQRR